MNSQHHFRLIVVKNITHSFFQRQPYFSSTRFALLSPYLIFRSTATISLSWTLPFWRRWTIVKPALDPVIIRCVNNVRSDKKKYEKECSAHTQYTRSEYAVRNKLLRISKCRRLCLWLVFHVDNLRSVENDDNYHSCLVDWHLKPLIIYVTKLIQQQQIWI